MSLAVPGGGAMPMMPTPTAMPLMTPTMPQMPNAGAHAGAVELTSDNYDELVKSSGKSAFIKFLAPW